ncbi:MAG: hypothetical protein HZC48_03545 [Nitrospirae bacterium]|nr:hypothetical protein [Nitrospirota bacterium]
MKSEGRKDIYFILYIIIIVILAVIYFTVPERALFIENQLKWWKEMWRVIVS